MCFISNVNIDCAFLGSVCKCVSFWKTEWMNLIDHGSLSDKKGWWSRRWVSNNKHCSSAKWSCVPIKHWAPLPTHTHRHTHTYRVPDAALLPQDHQIFICSSVLFFWMIDFPKALSSLLPQRMGVCVCSASACWSSKLRPAVCFRGSLSLFTVSVWPIFLCTLRTAVWQHEKRRGWSWVMICGGNINVSRGAADVS